MTFNSCFSKVFLLICFVISFSDTLFSIPQTFDNGNINGNKRPVKKTRTFLISGNVERTFSYCGGASPSEEMLMNYATPVAYPYKKFYIRCGKTNTTKRKVIKSFTTDSTGAFSIKLPKGIYSIILEEQLKKIKIEDYIKQNQQLDANCLNEWWAKPYYLLVVNDKNINELYFVFHHRCFIKSDIPCVEYIGPMPP